MMPRRRFLITLELSEPEHDALQCLSERDLRSPGDYLRFLLHRRVNCVDCDASLPPAHIANKPSYGREIDEKDDAR